MGRVVAVSGGYFDACPRIHMHAVTLSGKKSPNVLFIGTAGHDLEESTDEMVRDYGTIGCEVKDLSLVTKSCKDEEIDSLLAWADIIFVGGGDTGFMMQTWKEYGLDKKLKAVYESDSAVLTGVSAGAICWFSCGYSDSEFYPRNEWGYCFAEGMLDIFHMTFCPHYNNIGRRSFDLMMAEKDVPGLAMEDYTAFVENNGDRYFIRETENQHAYVIRCENGVMDKREVEFRDNFDT